MKKTKSILAVAIMDLSMSILPCCTVSGSTFSERINELGLDRILRDWSNDTYITIEEPSCAYVNITGATRMPEYKGDEQHCWMEVYDGLATISASGSSWMHRATLH